MQDHLLLLDRSGNSIISRLDPGCRECLISETQRSTVATNCPGRIRRRRGVHSSSIGHVYLCSADENLLNSSKLFKKAQDFYLEALDALSEFFNDTHQRLHTENRRLAHNITTLNAHILQEIHLLIPQRSLAGNARSQKEVIREALSSNLDATAEATLRILKNSSAIKNELVVFRRLRGEIVEYRPNYHKIHEVLRNVLSTFFQDF